MGTLIDSSVLIAAERGKLDLDKHLSTHPHEPIAIAAVTASELLHGVHRANKPTDRRRREIFVERVLADIPIAPFDVIAARVHAQIWAELASKGISVGAHDLMIAATALVLAYDVATFDQRSFRKIPGLKVVVW